MISSAAWWEMPSHKNTMLAGERKMERERELDGWMFVVQVLLGCLGLAMVDHGLAFGGYLL